MVNLLGINPKMDFNHIWSIFGINFWIMKSGESARYQPQQDGLEGGLETCLDHVGDQFFDYEEW